MHRGRGQRSGKGGERAGLSAVLVLSVARLVLPAAAQQQGPIKPPAPAAAPSKGSSAISNELPSIPVEQIIQRFAERESELRKERENFAYEQSFIFQTIDLDGRPDGEYRMDSDVLFTPLGKRYEKVTYAPLPTLMRLALTQQDLSDLQNVQPFLLSTEELPKYDVRYVGRQRLDELTTYVFDVAPKTIEKNQRYFQGRIWVDDHDLEIVKTDGKAVPDFKRGGNENIFPRFETYRENIEKNFWFPTYTRSDDVLHFHSGGDVRIRLRVRYKNYRRFRSSGRIVGPAQPVPPDKP